MKQILDCPFCDGIANLVHENNEFVYRKEPFKVVEHFYLCDKCHEQFTTTETDTCTVLQAHNQYREKYGIPFPEEITEIRAKYELSGARISEVLGLGINGYSNYERGEMPTQAIGNLINTIKNPEVFKGMLKRSKHLFTDGTFGKAMNKVDYLLEQERKNYGFTYKLNSIQEPSSLTGFKKPNKEKLFNLIVEFINRCDKPYNDRLKLNKLLFYTDFLNYKQFGVSITGLSYRPIQYGPVPTCYDNIFASLENENMITSFWGREENGSAKETFITDKTTDHLLFTENEQSIIDKICDTFGKMETWDMVDLSHKEKVWIEKHKDKEIIDYQENAFELQAI
jgi:putative zinc finger/helix-turn-helix YgiT family protein